MIEIFLKHIFKKMHLLKNKPNQMQFLNYKIKYINKNIINYCFPFSKMEIKTL
jgi:hypothetical protein